MTDTCASSSLIRSLAPINDHPQKAMQRLTHIWESVPNRKLVPTNASRSDPKFQLSSAFFGEQNSMTKFCARYDLSDSQRIVQTLSDDIYESIVGR